MSFSEKLIEVTFTLAQGEFEGGGNSATVSGVRISTLITAVGGVDQGLAELSIYGLSLSLMNQLSNVGSQYNVAFLNGISISAGDASGMSVVFQGQMLSAFIDAQGMPQVFFQVVAKPGFFDQIKPATPTSVQGSSDVATMMAALAKTMGFAFENSGVTAKLANAYYSGSAMQQCARIAKDAGIEWVIEKKTLIIMNPAAARAGTTPVISPETGMVGYPVFNQVFVIVTALFNPDVKFGGEIEIKSELTSANGKFIVQELIYELESLVPGGRWFMTITARTAGPTPP
jgi:hypothetical protein